MKYLEEHIFGGFECLVFTTDLYMERYDAKYWPVVGYLYTRTNIISYNILSYILGRL